jgi:hypothetical protein
MDKVKVKKINELGDSVFLSPAKTHTYEFLADHSLSWSRLSEQNLRVDKWSLCRG